MPKNKAKGGRQGKGKGGTSGAERRAIARDLPALRAIAESCDTLREEWRASGGDVSKWDRVETSRDGVVTLVLCKRGPKRERDGPQTSLSTLSSLTRLDLSNSGLMAFDVDIEELSQLRTIDFSGCASLVVLPAEIDTMAGLTVIGAEDVPRFDNESKIWERVDHRACDGCGRQFALETRGLKVCGRCRYGEIRYCSVHCQRVSWDVHKTVCSIFRGFRFKKCVVCGRKADKEEAVFPGCDCGRRCYCGEACQAEDWVNGTARSRPHSETCASGYLHLGPRSPPNTPPRTPPRRPPSTSPLGWSPPSPFPSDWEESEGS